MYAKVPASNKVILFSAYAPDNLLARQLLLQQKMDDMTRQLSRFRTTGAGNTRIILLRVFRMQENAYYIETENELETLLEKARSEYTRNKTVVR
jgi:hypothetical protein